ncbi:MAG: hypothetical protein DCF31_08515 [Alphaproteobacteria bacterium]|nr:MAG: hypothetical protein DCF31_08515 [Alphaproteobacteria bacterium]
MAIAQGPPAVGLGPEPAVAFRFQSLHALRGVCAIMVAALHLRTTGYLNDSILIHNSYRFVDFFFVLSGFVMAITYRTRLENRETRDYLVRRVGRLYPLHLVVLVAMIVVAVAGSKIGLVLDEFRWPALPANLILVQSWGGFDRLTWNAPSWSISTEIFAYGVFALAAHFATRRALDIVFVGLVASSLLIVLQAPEGMASTYDFGLARCIFGFFAGAIAASLWTQRRLRPRGEIVAVTVTVLAVCFLPLAAGALIVPLFAWVILVFASDAGPVSRLLAGRIPQMLGTLSYSIYMIHSLVVLTVLAALSKLTDLTGRPEGVISIIGPWWLCDGITLAYLGLVVALAAISYRLIERPGQAVFRRLENWRRPRTVEA